MSIWVVFKLIGSLALLMFGMKSMSDSLQKMAGPQLRHVLGAMTSNRFTGVLTGMFVTAAVQSSTATTLMTVSFVNAGLLTLIQAISVIMGAHIGTTVTAWIMSLVFSFNITDFVYPAFFLGIILIYMKKHRMLGDFLFGVAFLFLGLGTLKATGQDMVMNDTSGAISAFFENFNDDNIWNSFFFLVIGTVLTLCVQSSAAIMAITMTLCSTGVLHIDQGIMLVLGENIGTTITSNIVAMGANTQARRAALAHLLFNVFGVIWVLIVFYPFVSMVCHLVGYDPEAGGQAKLLPVVLAMFHTCFNVINTAILIGLIPQIERAVCWLLPEKEHEKKAAFRLQYIQSNLVQTPEIAVLQAQKETAHFAERMQRMFAQVRSLAKEEDEKLFDTIFQQIEQEEDHSDQTELAIAHYLEQVSEDHLSDATKHKIRQMLREVGELESIGDACYNLARTFKRKQESGKRLTAHQQQQLETMMMLCDDALTQMNIIMSGHRNEHDIRDTYKIENDINQLRDRLKAGNIHAVNDHEYDYALGTIFADLISGCEKLGDYVVNVVQARFGR